MPLVSIVTICRSNPNELRRTLASLSSRPHDGFEVVVVDGSPDNGCHSVIEEFSDRVSIYVHEADSGIYDAMNKGVRAATGLSVIMVNSGDVLHDASIFAASVVDHAAHLSRCVLYGDCFWLIGDTLVHKPAPLAIGAEEIRKGHFPSHQSILIPRAFLLNNAYNDGLRFSADTQLLAHAFRELPQIRLPITVSVFAFGGVSSSAASWKAAIALYREAISVRRLTTTEKVRFGAHLLVRRLIHMAVGQDGLENIQAAQAIRRSRSIS